MTVVTSSNEEGLAVRETLRDMVQQAIEYGMLAVSAHATEEDRIRYFTWRRATLVLARALGEWDSILNEISTTVARFR